MMYSVFFFQAEDGIRDIGVTGVQTCALPIFGSSTIFTRLACSRHTKKSDSVHAPRVRRRGARARGRRKIGRASCRERVESSVSSVASKKKTSLAKRFSASHGSKIYDTPNATN